MGDSNGMRDADGKFLAGHPRLGGRKRKPKPEYLEVLHAECSEDDWREGCQVAVEQFKAGDAQARAWLTKLLIPNGAQVEGAPPSELETLLSTITLEDLRDFDITDDPSA